MIIWVRYYNLQAIIFFVVVADKGASWSLAGCGWEAAGYVGHGNNPRNRPRGNARLYACGGGWDAYAPTLTVGDDDGTGTAAGSEHGCSTGSREQCGGQCGPEH